MKKSSVISSVLLLAFAFSVQPLWAGDLEWSGLYRIEGYSINNSELNDDNRKKDFGLHHLVLKPKIVAADGLTIYGRFDIMNSGTHPNSQVGQVFGSGVNTNNPVNGSTATNADGSNTFTDHQAADNMRVTQLYLTYTQEFGALIAGRVPLHFGLGMMHNSGEGLFDHWLDNRDLVGYKIQMGNLFIFPMYGKVSEGNSLLKNDDVTEFLVQLQYENPDTGMELGVFFQERKANDQGNDTPQGTDSGDALGGTNGVRQNKFSVQNTNIYVLKDTERYRFGLEAGFQTGKSGVATSATAGNNVNFSGYGLATEFEWRFRNGWRWGLKAGLATGDDPATEEEFEGYMMDRNYDIAFLMFNHPVGQADFFRTNVGGGGATAGGNNSVDTEMISNVRYARMNLDYKWSDKWSLDMALITASLDAQPINGQDIGSSVGYEFDFSLNFSPTKRILWQNGFGIFSPGEIFEGCQSATLDCGSELSYGLMTRAAISF